MTETIVLTVPETVPALYVVAVPRDPGDPAALVRSELRGGGRSPVADLTIEALDQGALHVEVQPAAPGVLPTDLLRVFGAGDDEVAAVDASPYTVVVEASYAPGWPPVHEVAARAAAAALARALGGRVIDGQVPRLLAVQDLEATVPADGEVLVSDLVLVPQSADETGTWLTTKGLGRFGLPELQVLGAPPGTGAAWTAVLTGAAWALLARWTDAIGSGEPPAIVELPEVLEVGVRAMAHAYGEDEPDGADDPALLRLEFTPATEPGRDEFLTVLPPRGHRGPEADFHADVVRRLFGDADPAATDGTGSG